MTKIEEIARAVWEKRESRKRKPEGWEFVHPNHPSKRIALEDALAVLQAIREPTEDALITGAAVEAEKWDGRCNFAVLGRADRQRYKDRLGEAFTAMIDHLIQEGKK